MVWVPKTQLALANDTVTADLVLDPSSKSRAAVGDVVGPLVAEQLADPTVSGIVTTAADIAVDAKVDELDLVQKSDPGIPEEVSATRRIVGIVDANGVPTFLVADLDSDGGPIPVAADLIFLRATLARFPEATRQDIATDAGARLGVKFRPKMPGVMMPIVDSGDRMVFTSVGDDGGMLPEWVTWLRGKLAAAPAWVTAAMLSSDVRDSLTTGGIATEITGATPNRALYANSHRTGNRVLIANTDDPSNPSTTADGWVLYDTTAGRRARPADGSSPAVPALTSMASLSTWGDSLTAVYPAIGTDENETYTYLLAQQLGMGSNYYNGGRGGEHMEEIATRGGGIQLKLSASVTVPASGGVAVVPDRIINAYITTTQGWQMGCTLDGIPGTLSRTANTNNYVFTRTTAGASQVVLAGAPFLSIQGEAGKSALQVVGGGMNDLLHNTGDSAAVLTQRVIDGALTMLDHHAAYAKRILFIGTITRTDWTAGTSNYTRVMTINNGLAAALGDRFVNVRSMIIADAYNIMAAQGITPDSTDDAQIAADTLPHSIMADATHYKDFVHAWIKTYLYNRIVQKGWTA